MLQIIRDRAQGFFAWLIIGAIIIAFALTGLNSYFSDTDSGFQAALVNDEKVTVYEYRIAYQNERARMEQMFGENFDADLFDDQIKQSALDRVIENEVLMQYVNNAGLFISDEQLARTVHEMDSFKEDGQFSNERYEQQFARSGESLAGFEYRMRRGLTADQFVGGIIATSFATQDEIETTLRLREQQREVAYVTVSSNAFKEQLEITDEEITAHYDANQDSYKTDEEIRVNYLELSIDSLLPKVEVEESELEDYYEEQKDRFMTPESRHARHILVEFGDDEDAAKTKAQGLYDKAIAGESFEELAKSNSDDIGSASEGGDLGFFSSGVMDENFETKTFAMKVGEISEPVRSSFGYHIIKLEEIKPSEGKSFSDVREEILSELKKQKAEKRYFDDVEQLANLTYEAPETLTDASEELGLDIKTSSYFGRRGAPGIFSNRKVLDAAFSDDVLKENFNSAAIELSSTHAVVIRLNDFKAAQVRPLEQVKGQIKAKLLNDKASEKALELATVIEEKIKAGATGIDALKDLGQELTWNEKTWIDRASTGFPRDVVQAAFALPRTEEGQLVTKAVKMSNGDYSLIAFTGIKDGDITAMSAEEKDSMKEGISRATGIDSYTNLLESIKGQAEIERFPGNIN